METKLFEIRDRMTMIPVLAIKMGGRTEEERYLLARSGFGRSVEAQDQYVMLVQIVGGEGKAQSDPEGWPHNPRTYHLAHNYILREWEKLKSGDVVCIEFISGERDKPKTSERVSFPYPTKD
jgi:hypothetical protein